MIYSGTVAAAMEGRHLGLPAIAVSLNGETHYNTAAEITCRLLTMLQQVPLRAGNILNVNVPDVPLSEIKGMKVTRCGTRGHRMWSTHRWIRKEIRCTGSALQEKLDTGPDTDFAAVDAGYVSVTPLHVDLTAYSVQEKLEDWLQKAGVIQE